MAAVAAQAGTTVTEVSEGNYFFTLSHFIFPEENKAIIQKLHFLRVFLFQICLM